MNLEDKIRPYVDKYLSSVMDSLAECAASAYIAGSFHAAGLLKTGISFKVLQAEALKFAEAYRKKLYEQGIITVTSPVYDLNGNITGYAEKEIKWMSERAAEVRNELATAIERGIAEGKPVGARVGKNGRYPTGSIAADIQHITDQYRNQAATIARTETSRSYFKGEIERYTNAGVQYVQYLGGADACDECQPDIGKVFRLGSEIPLPRHPNCRCDYRAYFPGPGEFID